MAPVKFFVPLLDFRTSQVAIYRLTIYDCDHLSGSEKWSSTKLFLWNMSRIAPGKIRKSNYLLLVLVAWVRGAGPSIWHWRRQFQHAESWKEMCIYMASKATRTTDARSKWTWLVSNYEKGFRFVRVATLYWVYFKSTDWEVYNL